MTYRKVWLLAFVGLLFSVFCMQAGFFTSRRELSVHGATNEFNSSWKIGNGQKTLYEDAAFGKLGSLKTEPKLVLTKELPATADQNLCFITIGYGVKVFIDNQRLYSFGSSLESKAVWGVKTHIVKIPDGNNSRELKLIFSTRQPRNIAVSKDILLGAAPDIIRALLVVDLVKILFALFYISIGIFILLFRLLSAFYKKFDLSLPMLAFIALLIGTGILFNISFIAFHTGPEAVYWIVNLVNLTLPIPTLLFVAADKNFKKCRLLLTMTGVQAVFLVLWLVCNLLNRMDFFLLEWHLGLFPLTAAILVITFATEFKTGSGRPEVAVSVIAILLTSVINAYSYFTSGNHDAMDFSLIILALPVLILMTGRVAISYIQKEQRIMNENMTLRIEGELLYKNYHRINEYIERTKRTWHDIDKHMSIIQQLVHHGAYRELNQYMEQMGLDFKKTKGLVLCENKLVNAIVADKMSDAQTKGIKMSVSGDLPEKLAIPGNALCSLLVNMLDNAIEACEKLPPGTARRIDLSLKMKQGFIYFEVFNTAPPVPGYGGKTLVTSKKDKEKHGYGLTIIRKIAEQYDGAFDIIPSENCFLVKAALKNRPER